MAKQPSESLPSQRLRRLLLLERLREGDLVRLGLRRPARLALLPTLSVLLLLFISWPRPRLSLWRRLALEDLLPLPARPRLGLWLLLLLLLRLRLEAHRFAFLPFSAVPLRLVLLLRLGLPALLLLRFLLPA